jgi:hypothetical protein
MHDRNMMITLRTNITYELFLEQVSRGGPYLFFAFSFKEMYKQGGTKKNKYLQRLQGSWAQEKRKQTTLGVTISSNR